MDAQPQTRQVIAAIASNPGTHSVWFRAAGVKHHGAAFPKPGDRLSRGSKPGALSLQFLKQVTIRCLPESFRSKAAIVPVNGHAAAKLHGIIQQLLKQRTRLFWREVQMVW